MPWALLPSALLLLVTQPSFGSLGGIGALTEDDECHASGDQSCALQALQLRRGLRAGHDRVLEQAIQVQELEASEMGLDAVAQEILPTSAAVSAPAKVGPAEKKCSMTALKLLYGSKVGVFGLPGNASVGTLVRTECRFGDKKYPHGEVTFECFDDRWHYKSDTCALCPEGSLPVETGSLQGAVACPRATRAGETAERSCNSLRGKEAVYRYGTVTFTCQANGTWAYEKDSCGVCPSSDFTLTYGGDPGIFKLPPASVEGMEVERPCNFNRQNFSLGTVKFKCADGEWKYASDTCASCEASNVTATEGDNEGTFHLPRAGRIGETAWQYCVFGEHRYNWGVVYFQCGTGGWSVLNKTCAACAPTRPFKVSYGADVGTFRLPAASKEGELKDEPCIFGATNFSSGVVQFVCEAGRWNLRTVTCVQSGEEEIPVTFPISG